MKQLPAGIGTADGIRQALKLLSQGLTWRWTPPPTYLARIALIGFLIIQLFCRPAGRSSVRCCSPSSSGCHHLVVLRRGILPLAQGRTAAPRCHDPPRLVMLLPMIFLSGDSSMGSGLVAKSKPLFRAGPTGRAAGHPRQDSALRLRDWTNLAAPPRAAERLLQSSSNRPANLRFPSAPSSPTGLLQLILVTFILFFYRDGSDAVGRALIFPPASWAEAGRCWISPAARSSASCSASWARRLRKGAVALIGFLIAGVPAVALLAFATFFFPGPGRSGIPVGRAAWWLYDSGQTGWAIFMVAWGVLVISSIDNFVKPILISRGARFHHP